MPLTVLDEKTALVAIDLQKGILGAQLAHPAGEIAGRTGQLAGAFRERGLPVVLVHVTGAAPGRTDSPRRSFDVPPDFAEFVPELNRQPNDHVIEKQRWGAFLGTDLHATLNKLGVTQIVLTGVATSIGVESTARSAYDLGYNVVLVCDAITDRDPEAHRFCFEKIFPRLGEVDTTAAVLSKLRG